MLFYETETNSLYVKIRRRPSVRQRMVEERKAIVDYGDDGEPVG